MIYFSFSKLNLLNTVITFKSNIFDQLRIFPCARLSTTPNQPSVNPVDFCFVS